ncbi:MAG: ABC transporter substrate-binding protein [Clostridia bacterium]|nr:ABC transporter substrate-binding protein [Clostridia bacterium]
MKKLIKVGLMVLGVMTLMAGCAKAEEGGAKEKVEETFKIGITQIVEHPALDSAREGFIAGLNEAGFEGRVEFVEKNAQGEMPTAQIIAQGFVDDQVDMIYAIATPTAQAALNATKDIPIMISAVTDPVAAGLVESNEAPNGNVSGTSDEAPIDLQLQLLQDMGIEASTIGFIYNTSEKNSEVQLAQLTAEAEKLGMSVEVMGITSLTELEQGIDVLLDKVDVLYTPTDNMVASGIQLIVNKAMNKKVPVLGAEPAHVEAGALATCGVNYFELGRQTGQMAADVLNGADISEMPVQKALNPSITINKASADQLGVVLSDELLSDSEIIGEN